MIIIKDSYYILSGIMIAWGLAFVFRGVLMVEDNLLFSILGIFGGGLFIGIGLTPFPMRDVIKKQ